MTTKRHPCPACGHLTIEVRGDWEVCQICCWEDDVYGWTDDSLSTSSANHSMRLCEAQANYYLFGVADLEAVEFTRDPLPKEISRTPLKLSSKAQEIVAAFDCARQHRELPGYNRKRLERDLVHRLVGALAHRSAQVRQKAAGMLRVITDLPEDDKAALRKAEEK
ncbi:hypothetical protein LCGC14_2959140 [marine sediment metagenome]|uniref:Cysteine-rich CPCC domain-containing protein n=1 Tax=marine sediment metagenome TaxID=412755 RepID=A0A0F8Y080_9ZZZZ